MFDVGDKVVYPHHGAAVIERREEKEVFPGCPEMRNGYYFANDKPGLGIDLDEKLAARFPIQDDPPFDMGWGNVRRRDGTIVKP